MMMTFNEYIERKQIDTSAKQCAQLISELNIDAEELVTFLLEGTELSEAWKDWLSGVGNKVGGALKKWGSAAGQVGRSVYDGGLKSGINQAKDTIGGPVVKFDKAEAVLDDLVKFLSGNEQTKGLASAGNPRQTIAQYLSNVLNMLRKEKENIPKVQQAQVTQNYAPRDGGASRDAAKSQLPQQPQYVQSSIWNPATKQPFMRKVS